MVENKGGVVETTEGGGGCERLDPLDWDLFVDLFAGFVCLREIVSSKATSCAHVN